MPHAPCQKYEAFVENNKNKKRTIQYKKNENAIKIERNYENLFIVSYIPGWFDFKVF